jgi:TrpR-related protein YerC/YecD
MKNLKNLSKDRLFEAILSLKTVEECYAFFTDLATVQEMQDFADRLEVATLLEQKKSYAEIELKTKMSSTTIARVAKALHYGEDGYRLVLDRLKSLKK